MGLERYRGWKGTIEFENRCTNGGRCMTRFLRCQQPVPPPLLLGSGATARCQACLSALYCNRTCQRQAWKQHKKQCTAGSGGGGSSSEGGAAASSSDGQAPRLLRLKPGRENPYTSTIPHSALAQQISAAMGMTSQPARPLAEAAVTRGPEEQAAAAARRDHKLFMVKIQVRWHWVPGAGNEFSRYVGVPCGFEAAGVAR